jgi:hypothetical protein
MNYFYVQSSEVVAPICIDEGPIVWPQWASTIMYCHMHDLCGPINLVASIVDELDGTSQLL